tara:strand:- start:2800 stop:3405 length:606 start_codon:yes stop_codon:yes gene_type:complete
MPSSAAPYGLKPVKRADGMPYAGAVTHYLIDPAGVANNIFTGSIVQLTAAGYVELADGTGKDITTNNFGGSSIGALGVFMGCDYVNTEGQTIYSSYYPTGTTGVVHAYVVDDPNVLFQAQLDAVSGQDDIGTITGFAAAQNATTSGSTTTGNSTMALDATVQTTVGGLKIVGFVSPVGDTYPDVLVRFTTDGHLMTMSTGV